MSTARQLDDLRKAVDRAIGFGLCAVPPVEDGSKKPQGVAQFLDERNRFTWRDTGRPALGEDGKQRYGWTAFQTERPSLAHYQDWYDRQGRTGIGLVCGAVSNNLEMLEFERRAIFNAFTQAAEAAGMGEVWHRVVSGYLEDTPGGGVHTLYFCEEIAGNTELASRPKRPEEMAGLGDKWKVEIETRGEGGYTVIAPSNGKVHPTGGVYRLINGGLEAIVTISPEDREALFALARTFDQKPRAEFKLPKVTAEPDNSPWEVLPGDAFNAGGNWERDVLTPAGWTFAYEDDGRRHYRRPGKDKGVSGNLKDGLFYCFTSSTPLAANKGHTAFTAYALLFHNGDFSATAKALFSKGYGKQRPQQTKTDAVVPRIDAGNLELPSVAAHAWAAIRQANDPAFLFRYGGQSTRIERDDHRRPVARALTEDRLRHELARAAWWFKGTKDGDQRPALPPTHVVKDMLAARELDLPVLTRIVEAPTFAPDGSLHDQAGYHTAGQTFYVPQPGFTIPPIPGTPTAAQVAAARTLLANDLLGDFPFVGDAERAHALALLLLPFARAFIDGPTPLHLIEKPSPGTGASLLTDVIGSIATGRPVAAMTEGEDEDEWRKRITAVLRDAPAMIIVDNLRRRLDSAAVSSAITQTFWTDRILGTSDTVRLPIACAWVATGNNPALSSEISRRCIRIRLDARLDRPWLRTEFRHPKLRTWVDAHRAGLVTAALTLIRAWLVAGRPAAPAAPTLGMFESWAEVMGGILSAAGVPGFLGNLAEFYDSSDTEGAVIRAFLGAWWAKHGEKAVGVAALFEVATDPDSSLELGDKGERSQRSRFGRLLTQLRDRHYTLTDGPIVRISDAGKYQGAQQWRLARS